MNLQEALQELGEPLSEVMAYAKKQDIRAESESRVKDLADAMNLTPTEYLDRLLPGKGILSDHEQWSKSWSLKQDTGRPVLFGFLNS